MRYLSVCSGIEAATAAWHPLGWEPVAFAEIDKFPSAVLAHHYPNVPNMGDFTTIKAADVGPIDILVGGTPCQSFSVAGLRGGLADDRGNLALEFLRLADRARPKWLVWENVPGVLSSNGGRDFGSILGGLVELRYGFAYRVADAQHFGVPQRRRRVFVVGHLGDWRRAAAVLFERHSLQGHPTPSRKAGQGVAGTVDASLGGSDENDAAGGRLVARCDAAGQRYDGESETFVAHALRADGFDASEDGTGRGTPLTIGTLTSNGDAHSGFKDEHELVPLFASGCHGSRNAGVGRDGDPSFALDTTGGMAVAFQSNFSNQSLNGDKPTLTANAPTAASIGAAVRRLTPRECERLQGFADDWTLIPYRGKLAADGPRYKSLGNSMAVPVMAWLGQRIALVDKLPLPGQKTAPQNAAIDRPPSQVSGALSRAQQGRQTHAG